ncbi:TIGR03960 family B12-binding radical SAM protein [Emergencia sp.]|uniref:TIGR03960 family B12-binding radical SAM protein n=1 Tax=Emergencia sp. TaxID=1926557 RepID=UPI003AF178A1
MNLNEKLNNLLKRVEKPARYIGGETNIVIKDPRDVKVRFAFAFPDLYEIGMSYMGLQILYNILNKEEDVYCERVFAPAPDMEELMREEEVPLFTLETKTPMKEMDFLGFTLQYEMSFTSILDMMELAGIALKSTDRLESDPIVVAGGPCAFNPEPLADFIDVFLIGDGEESLPNLMKEYAEAKDSGISKNEFLKQIANEEGVYIPSLYDVTYHADGTIASYEKKYEEAPDRVTRCIIDDIENTEFPTEPIVPFIETVHDRSVIETFRGCTRGCRFCQAGMIYRPVRERSKETIMSLASEQLKNTGHEELSLLSLSTSDYSEFESLAIDLMKECKGENVSLSLPSLRLDTFSFNVLEEIQGYKKSGLTFAPEAGTQRLRDVINKGITEKDIYDAVEQAIELGWKHIKLYFMIGLPTETYEDLDGIAEIAQNIVNIHRKSGHGGRFNVTVSVSNFVPKAHTPFQWVSQNSTETFTEKHNYLHERLKIKGVTFNYHDDAVSTFEAIFARGDRRLSALLLAAHRLGCRLDGWSEHFDLTKWKTAIEQSGIDADFYTTRERRYDEVLPWDIIDSSITKKFLQSEAEKAMKEVTTKDCRYGCSGCGINRRVKCKMGGIYE